MKLSDTLFKKQSGQITREEILAIYNNKAIEQDLRRAVGDVVVVGVGDEEQVRGGAEIGRAHV